MQNFGMSMLWFWVCYAIVTCVGILHTIFNIYVLKMKPMDENGMGEGYEKTKPWHPLYNIILFSLFGWVLIKHPWSLSFKEFYVDYQPWITLIYLAIFAGPVVGYLFIFQEGKNQGLLSLGLACNAIALVINCIKHRKSK